MARKPAQGSKTVDENSHLSFEGLVPKKHKLTDVVAQFLKGKSAKAIKKVADDHLSWDEVFEDAYLADLYMASDADLKNGLRLAIDTSS